jgi:hypothetical protein
MACSQTALLLRDYWRNRVDGEANKKSENTSGARVALCTHPNQIHTHTSISSSCRTVINECFYSISCRLKTTTINTPSQTKSTTVISSEQHKKTTFTDIAPCSLFEVDRRFRGAYVNNIVAGYQKKIRQRVSEIMHFE